MSINVRNDTVTDNLGNAIAGARVFYLTQPADTTNLTPLANVYSDTSGTPAANPQISDGSGRVNAYLSSGQLYTIVYVFPCTSNVIYKDEFVGAVSTAPVPFGQVPVGTQDGTNRVFTLPFIPTQVTVWDNFPLIPGLGFTAGVISGTYTITFATAPATTDALWCQGYI